jgi:rod shape-determining protein MreD
MGSLLGFLIIPFLIILQMVVMRRLELLNGIPDIVLLCVCAWSLQPKVKGYWVWGILAGLMLSTISGVPGYLSILLFPGIVGVSRVLQKVVWQAPILAMLVVISIGTIGNHLLTILVLQLSGSPITMSDGIFYVLLPSAILNLILAVPVYAIMRDLANLVYPIKVEV